MRFVRDAHGDDLAGDFLDEPAIMLRNDNRTSPLSEPTNHYREEIARWSIQPAGGFVQEEQLLLLLAQ